MPLRIKCPTGHTLIVPDDRAGRTLKCPRCEQSVVVPGTPKPSLASRSRQSANEARSVALSQVAIPPPPAVEPPPVIAPAAAEPIEPPPVISPPAEIAAQDAAKESPNPSPETAHDEPPPSPTPEPASAPSEPAAAAVETPLTPVEVPSERSVEKSVEQQESAAFAEVAAPEEPEPEPPPQVSSPPAVLPPPAAPVLPGIIPDRSRVLLVYQLAAAVGAAALFSIAPALWDIVEYFRIPDSHFVARWALGLLFLGVVQVAYATYVVQLPDWGSVWVVTLYCLALAALYAMGLGLALLSPEDGAIVRFLQLGDKIANHKAALWCLCMVSVATLLAFFAGRLSVRWHHAELLLRSMRR